MNIEKHEKNGHTSEFNNDLSLYQSQRSGSSSRSISRERRQDKRNSDRKDTHRRNRNEYLRSHSPDRRSGNNSYNERNPNKEKEREQERDKRRSKYFSRSPSRERKGRKRSGSRDRKKENSEKENKGVSSILSRLKKKNPEEKILSLKNEICFLLNDNSKRMKYSRTIDWEKKKNIIHWGQRKLFISELWFLTKYGELGKHVVYAGSAPGTHIPFLAQLFPEHYFVLVDPSNFDMKQLVNDKTNVEGRIKTQQEYFTDELATQLGKEYNDILFISDIRTANFKEQDKEKVEIMVIKDTEKQRDWMHIMKAKKSLLKFRCPYPDREYGKNNLKMLKGEIFIQPYAAPTSTETRLIPDDSLEEIEYDNLKYEEQLYYHNHVTRRELFNQPIEDGEGLDRSWDISAEIVIIYDFLKKFPQYYAHIDDIFEKIKRMSKDISRNIAHTARNLETPMVPPEKRRNFAARDHTKFYPDLEMENSS